MADNQRTNLMRPIFTLYQEHCGLFWRIMLPVAIIAIALEVVVFFFSVTRVEKYIDETNYIDKKFRANAYTTVGNVNTIRGVYPTISLPKKATSAEAPEPDVNWRILPIPYFTSTDSEGITWNWGINFQSFDYGPLILLLLTLCPLSLAVARISQDVTPPTAREMWRQTGRKAFKILIAFFLFILGVDIVSYFYALVSWLVPSLVRGLSVELVFVVTMVYQAYLLVTLSLYNPCLILENNAIIGVFRRSHALVSGARLRFFGIYLLIGWMASVVTSVLLGVALLAFSTFVPDLAPVRDALPPLKFLSLFIGGDIEIVLPQLLSVPTTVAILIVKGLIATFLAPIWAILTTHLYFQRVDVIKEATES